MTRGGRPAPRASWRLRESRDLGAVARGRSRRRWLDWRHGYSGGGPTPCTPATRRRRVRAPSLRAPCLVLELLDVLHRARAPRLALADGRRIERHGAAADVGRRRERRRGLFALHRRQRRLDRRCWWRAPCAERRRGQPDRRRVTCVRRAMLVVGPKLPVRRRLARARHRQSRGAQSHVI